MVRWEKSIMEEDFFICHYHEIALKGENRKWFEEKLVGNIKKVLPRGFFESVRRISGRIIVKAKKGGAEDFLKNVFGIAYFARATACSQDMGVIEKEVCRILKKKKFRNFRITAKRSKKDFVLTSPEINQRVGAFIVKNLKKKVDLDCPDITCFIEIVEKYVFLYTEKIKGPGGLPVSTGGKAVCLLSGGIDSPAAAFKIMKRGVEIVFLHFHAYPYTGKASIEKVRSIVEVLNKYQTESRLYLIPFSGIQKEILMKTPDNLRVILYRRMMLRIAQEIAKTEKAKAIVTGESIGQVASQTLENIRVIEQVADMPVLRPLIGEDKEEIINLAERIGTFRVSILPHQDCCARFLPKHPATKADLRTVIRAEKKLDIKRLVGLAVAKAEIKRVGA
jgi:thiamine biosynthesis protein ThiI